MSIDYIFDSGISFEEKALKAFRFQFNANHVYRRFCLRLGLMFPETVEFAADIPLLPIECFKWTEIRAFDDEPELEFRSSGTGNMQRSMHLVKSAQLYQTSIRLGFNLIKAESKLPLLIYAPGYVENPHSSLVWMLNDLVKHSGNQASRFLPLTSEANRILKSFAEQNIPVVLFGAAFGLLELMERDPVTLAPGSLVIETGGMKTYRKEVSRAQLHSLLAKGFGISASNIISEYGMAEMLSQAYRIPGQGFVSPHWLNLSVRDFNDPASLQVKGKEGRLGLIDLANWYSCPFILSADRAVHTDEGLEISGRVDETDLRGCNFLYERDGL